jgi:glucosamine--fructose-6-phosphate aminotransferase (isomerizing)
MCGIVGYVGSRECLDILMDGLKRLEYRGYDSAGVALINGSGIVVEKNAGKISDLEKKIDSRPIAGSVGIAHTRWATHGEPNTNNAHPHVDGSGDIALVHNGIIENYQALKSKLESGGHTFHTDTDTEVVVHLIGEYYNGNLEEAVATALALVEGTYGIAVVAKQEPRKIVGARMGSPLVVGVGDGEYWVASDVSAILRYTKNVVYLDDGEMVIITPDAYKTTTIDGRQMQKEVQQVEWDLEQIEK